MDGDYDGDWIEAAYESHELAKAHVERAGYGRIEEGKTEAELVPLRPRGWR